MCIEYIAEIDEHHLIEHLWQLKRSNHFAIIDLIHHSPKRKNHEIRTVSQLIREDTEMSRNVHLVDYYESLQEVFTQ